MGVNNKKCNNILVVNPFAESISGNDEVLTRVISKLEGKYFHFIVVQTAENTYTERYRKMGAEVEFTKMSIIRRNFSPGYLLGYVLGFIPTVYRIIKICKKYEVVLAHTNTTQILGAGLAAKILGLPSIYHAHSYSITRPEWVIGAMTAWFKLTGDRIFANSPLTASIFSDRGYPPEKIKVIWNPVDLNEFDAVESKNAFRKELRMDDNAPLIGVVGRIARIKNIEHFIDAASILSKRYPDAKFVIVGDAHGDEDKKYLEELKNKTHSLNLDDNITFTGKREDIPSIMHSLTALAHTCIYEGFGLVVAEAMAAEKPVVAAGTGAMPYVVDDGVTGLLTPFGDCNAMADAISSLIDNPELAKTMGEKGREKVERLWRAETVANLVAETYLQLLKKDRP